MQFYVAADPNRFGASGGIDAVVVSANPGNERSVVEPKDDFRPHRHGAATTQDLADEYWRPGAHRHAIDDRHRAFAGLVVRFEN